MKEDIKNVQSLQVNLEGEDFVFNRFGNMFVFNEDNKVETIDGSFSSNRNIQLSEDSVKNLDYTVLTYTEEYKQKLEDEYEATLQNKVDCINTNKTETIDKKRVRKYNQIAKKLDEYSKELTYATVRLKHVQKELADHYDREYADIRDAQEEPELREQITVLSNMIKLLEWVLKIK